MVRRFGLAGIVVRLEGIAGQPRMGVVGKLGVRRMAELLEKSVGPVSYAYKHGLPN